MILIKSKVLGLWPLAFGLWLLVFDRAQVQSPKSKDLRPKTQDLLYIDCSGNQIDVHRDVIPYKSRHSMVPVDSVIPPVQNYAG